MAQREAQAEHNDPWKTAVDREQSHQAFGGIMRNSMQMAWEELGGISGGAAGTTMLSPAIGTSNRSDLQRAIENRAGDIAGRRIAQEFGPESQHQPFLDGLRAQFGTPGTSIASNGMLLDTRNVSLSRGAHRESTNRLAGAGRAGGVGSSSTTSGIENRQVLLQDARREGMSNRLRLNVDEYYASTPPAEEARTSTGSRTTGGASFFVSPPPASSNASTAEVAASASFASSSSTPAHYEQEDIEKQVQEMYNRVVRRSLLVSQVVVASHQVVNIDSGAVEEIQDSSQQDLARERLIYLLNDENRSFLFNLIENLLGLYAGQQGQGVPSSQDVADSIDNIQTGYPSPPRRKYRRS